MTADMDIIFWAVAFENAEHEPDDDCRCQQPSPGKWADPPSPPAHGGHDVIPLLQMKTEIKNTFLIKTFQTCVINILFFILYTVLCTIARYTYCLFGRYIVSKRPLCQLSSRTVCCYLLSLVCDEARLFWDIQLTRVRGLKGTVRVHFDCGKKGDNF